MPWFQTARKLVFEIRPTVHIPVKASVFDNNQAFWKLPGKLWNGTKDQERPRKAKKGQERPRKARERPEKGAKDSDTKIIFSDQSCAH